MDIAAGNALSVVQAESAHDHEAHSKNSGAQSSLRRQCFVVAGTTRPLPPLQLATYIDAHRHTWTYKRARGDAGRP